MWVDSLLLGIPPLLVYLGVAVVVLVESIGIPVPGEIVLVSAALLSSRHELAVSPVWIAVAASAGAIVGDSIGYGVGRRHGRGLFDRRGRRFPKHFGHDTVAFAEDVFARWGVLAVFFGRFVALLRIFAGPIAGTLGMPYRRFLPANVLGGITWAAGTTFALYYLGIVAETWLSRFSYVGLGLVVVVGLGIGLVVRRKTERLAAEHAAQRDRPYDAA